MAVTATSTRKATRSRKSGRAPEPVVIPAEGKFYHWHQEERMWHCYYDGHFVGATETPNEAREFVDSVAYKALSK